MDSHYLHVIKDRALIFDGAMGTSIQQYELTASDFGGPTYEGCNDYLVITRPHIIEEIHRSFLAAGADVLETNTFRANRWTMQEYQLEDRIIELNMAAAQLARRVADEFLSRFVAGSIGPTGMLPSTNDPLLSNITYGELVEVFREQAVGLLRGGVDLLLIETSQDILEVKATIEGLKRAMRDERRQVPIQVQVSLDTSGRMLLGTDISAVLAILESLGIDIIGLNCSTGPDYMREPVRYLSSHTKLPIAVIPNAGLPLNVDGCAIYPMKPVPMAEQLAEFVTEFGVNIVGGCCGSTPEHIRELVAHLPKINPWQRRPAEMDDQDQYQPRLASAMRAITMRQEPPPLMVGERVNTLGSRKVKRLLLNDQYDPVLDIARNQVEWGAHTLDVCVATTERTDEDQQMRTVVKMLQQGVDAPLVIDSTEPDVMKIALENNPGRAILNSVHLESGPAKLEQVAALARQHGAAMVAMCIDEQGQAETAERKVEVAVRIYDLVVNQYAMSPDQLIFDTLVFPITTGQAQYRNAGKEVIDAIRRIKQQLPGVYTILGVSNVSFGMKRAARYMLNSVFLHHAVEAGLDMAIVNPAHIKPYAEISPEHRKLMDDLIFNTDENALARVIEAFEQYEHQQESAADPTEGMSVFERLYWRILHRKKDGIEADIDEAVATAVTLNLTGDMPSPSEMAIENLDASRTQDKSKIENPAVTNDHAVWLLNNVLLPAMKEVGDKFGAGELILPFVLQSAEAMKKAVSQLERYLEKLDGATKGTVVLATVFGDVHDIGKNLVGTILENNGYTVVDLGKQVPVNTIIDAAIEHNATAVGLSALLVSTSKQMPIAVKEMHKRGLNVSVLIGGAAINRRFGYRALFPAPNEPYQPGVFYCTDAFEGLDTMEALVGPNRQQFVANHVEEALEGLQRAAELAKKREQMAAQIVDVTSTVTLLPANEIPTPPFWGATAVPPRAIALHEVWQHFDLKTLYRLHWGGRGKKGAEWENLVKNTFEPKLRAYQEELERSHWLDLGIVYGYFPVQRADDTIIVYDPKEHSRELFRWRFPRQKGRKGLCLADYIAPSSSGIMDVLPLQLVTAGTQATQRMEDAQARGDYTEVYFLNGFTNELAEGLASWNNARIRKELGLNGKRGLRYAWGYPACPDMSQHEQLFSVLPTEQINVRLTTGYQLNPEQSTAALIMHHPDAIYFGTGQRNREAEEAIREIMGDL